jgi:hypothetical protein
MEQLPPQMLPGVPYLKFGIFDLAIPNIIAWLAVILIFFVGAWTRLPKFFEPNSE